MNLSYIKWTIVEIRKNYMFQTNDFDLSHVVYTGETFLDITEVQFDSSSFVAFLLIVQGTTLAIRLKPVIKKFTF